MGVCTSEAFEIYGDDVSEIDVSDLTVDEIVCEIDNFISGKKSFSVGEIDFMGWLISKP
jgi:adenylate kinase